MLILICISFYFRAKARPSKRGHVDKPSDGHVTVEPVTISEPERATADATLDDLPPPDHVSTEQVEVDTAVQADKPVSPVRTDDGPSSSVKATDIPPTPVKAAGDKEDEVIITGVGHTSPGHPVVLAKHSAMEERAAMEKGKWSTDLSSYAHLSAQELHSGFLNRLHSNRDYEAGLVNLMKERYEVFSSLFPFLNPICKYQLK